MLEFEIIQTLKPNNKILGEIKEFTYKVKKGAVKHILHTNLQVIEPLKIRRLFVHDNCVTIGVAISSSLYVL